MLQYPNVLAVDQEAAVAVHTAPLYPASQWPGRIPSLDGVRALSFLLVFVSHMGFLGSRPGGFAVSVFFVLSGYLITTLLIREHNQTGSISLCDFYFRRTLRIFPSMYIVLLVCALLSDLHILKVPFKGAAVLFSAIYLENYAFWWNLAAGRHSFYVAGTGHFWSLCVEEHFYLLFPFLLVAMLRKKMTFEQISKTLLFICFLALAWRIIAVHVMPIGEEYCYLATDTRLDSILWGCFLATAEHHSEWRSYLTYERLFGLLPFCAMALILTFVFHTAGRMTFRFTIQSIALLPILYFVTHFEQSRIARPLNNPVLVHIGVLSYALYLVHGAVIEIVTDHIYGHRMLTWTLCFAIAYLLALALHCSVERPFYTLRARHRST